MAEIKDKKSPAEESKDTELKNQESWKVEQPNLEHGTGTPYLALFQEDGNPILNPITGIALGAYISKFVFKSSDEKEDACVLTFDTGDPNTVDIEAIQEGKIINVQWGYIYSNASHNSSKVHGLEIKQLEMVFDDRGTHVTLHCKDVVSNLRHSIPYKPNGTDQTMKDFLDSGCGCDQGIIIIMYE